MVTAGGFVVILVRNDFVDYIIVVPVLFSIVIPIGHVVNLPSTHLGIYKTVRNVGIESDKVFEEAQSFICG